MILKFNITTAPDTIILRFGDQGDQIAATVDWGDGSAPETFTTSGKKYHQVSQPGEYIVTITGTVPIYGSGQPANDDYLLTEVVSLGTLGTTNFIGAFAQCKALTTVSGLLPPNVTNMQGVFYQCDKLQTITDINNWDVSTVTDMHDLFAFSTFNQPLNNWNTSNVDNMNSMFSYTPNFNQDLSSWCVANITTKPFDFDTEANSWTGGDATRPQWGQPC